jgi:Leucine-rich repeat (LRR) protein
MRFFYTISDSFQKSFLTLMACLCLQTADAQLISDAQFAEGIRSSCPTCIDATNTLTAAAADVYFLNLSNRNIRSISGIEGFTNLFNLLCNDNLLTTIPVLPRTLTNLDCSGNSIASLTTAVLPSGLRVLDCSNNDISSLSNLPSSILNLRCENNALTSLGNIPPNLYYLGCSRNGLSRLTNLPSSLTTLECNFNQLTSISFISPSNLATLSCVHNELTSLPSLPSGLISLNCADNLLSCLPMLPVDLQYLVVDSKVSCLPNIISGLTVEDPSGNALNLTTCLPTVMNAPSLAFNQCIGNSAILSTRAVGGSGLTITWQRKKMTDADFVNVTTASAYTSNSLANYVSPALTAADEGTLYRAVFSGGCPVITEPAVVKISKGINIYDLFFANAIRRDCPECIDPCNNLTDAAAFRTSLKVDNSASNQLITDLAGIENFKKLVTLDISNNNIKRFPSMPNTLTTLKCINSGLAQLPTLSTNLEVLNCTANLLTSLPNLPSKLTNLQCQTNKLNVLPTLPNSLVTLYCANNPLRELGPLPSNLQTLICFKNTLTSLPALPNSLISLNCGNNDLYNLPTLPNALEHLVCSRNPNLSCLPALPNTLRALSITETNIACMPNSNSNLRTFDPMNEPVAMPPFCVNTNVAAAPSVSGAVYMGQTATLTAQASGSGSMTVRWQKKMMNATDFQDIPNSSTPYVSNSNATYTTPNLMYADNGSQYLAVFSASCINAVKSPAITLSVSEVLPVELQSFTGKAENRINKLFWETATQINLAHFSIERREMDTDKWTAIGKIAAQKDSKATLFYAFDDVQPLPLSYYRLVAVDLDGTFKYSNTLAIAQKTDKLTVQNMFPNPVNNTLNISFQIPQATPITITITDVLGQLVKSQIFMPQGGLNTTTIDVSDMPNGLYLLMLNDGKTNTLNSIMKR